MTYRDYKKKVAEKIGISLYALEKGMRSGKYHLVCNAFDFKMLKLEASYSADPEKYLSDCVAESVQFDAEHLYA